MPKSAIDHSTPKASKPSVPGDPDTRSSITGVLEELVGRTLSDIAAELSLLRQAKATLTDTTCEQRNRIAELEPELETLRKEKANLSGAVRHLMLQTGFVPVKARSEPIDISTLAPELLLHIFRAARTPRFQQDPAPGQGVDCIWLTELRFRKNLVLVCRSWSGPATEALYEDIVLRRMGQIAALSYTFLGARDIGAMTNRRRDLAQLVRSIRIDSCIVLPHCQDAIQDSLQTIFELCTQLRAFECSPHNGFPIVSTGRSEEPFNPIWFLHDESPSQVARLFQERCSTTLRVLDLAFTLSCPLVSSLHVLLASSVGLMTLRLGPIDHQVGKANLENLPPLLLPELRELHVYVDNPSFHDHVADRWNLPLLERLTTRDTCSAPLQILKKHGSRLTYLNLCPKITMLNYYTQSWQTPRYTKSLVETLKNSCPVLEHLVVIEDDTETTSHTLCNAREPPWQSLLYLDVWTHKRFWRRQITRPQSEWERALTDGELGIRTYSLRRLWRFHVDLPTLCDPAKPLTDQEAVMVRTPRRLFIQTKHSVFSEDFIGCCDGKPIELCKDSSKVSLPSLLRSREASEDPDWRSPSESGVPTASGSLADDSLADEEEDGDVEDDSGSESDWAPSEHDSDSWPANEQFDETTAYERFCISQAGPGYHCDTDSSEDED